MSNTPLDDLESIASIDRSNMLGVVESWAEQWDQGLKIGSSLRPAAAGASNVIVCGMGGSGIAGDVARSLVESTVPLEVRRATHLPEYADHRTLVICVSYSGNTAETLACFDDAIARGCAVVAICSGGVLAERARAESVTLCDSLPSGLMPRAALALLVVPLLAVLEKAGLIDAANVLEEARRIVEHSVDRWNRSVPTAENDAKKLALEISEKLPIIWGSEMLNVAALRLKCQLAENAKLPATVSMFPELCHNDIVGVHHGLAAIRDSILIAMSAEDADDRNRVFDAAIEIARPSVGSVALVRRASLIEALVFADFVSVYAGIARGVDPTPIEAIRKLKASVG